MLTVTGKNNITATILAHSINAAGKELITWELQYPRLILAELNTHRDLSRNSFSSRAVPFNKMLDQLNGEPVRFGANQAGMQDKGEDFDAPVMLDVKMPYDDHGALFGFENKPFAPRAAWSFVKEAIIELTRPFVDAGYHKQVYNRLLESFQMQKTVLSATETDNFFWLRYHTAADPTLHELARCMLEAKEASEPQQLAAGQWHLPYIDVVRGIDGIDYYYLSKEDVDTNKIITLEEAIKVSCARCAAVSYRNEGYGLEKSLEVYDRLVSGERKHASAFEHCATPMKECDTSAHGPLVNVQHNPDTWEPGITHMDRNMNLWSGNFQGWIQFRKLIPGERYTKG